jgi:hypothetical protein
MWNCTAHLQIHTELESHLSKTKPERPSDRDGRVVVADMARVASTCEVAKQVQACFTGRALHLITDLCLSNFTDWRIALLTDATGPGPQVCSKLIKPVQQGAVVPDQQSKVTLMYRRANCNDDLRKLFAIHAPAFKSILVSMPS